MSECTCEDWAESWECYNGSHKCADCKNWLPEGHYLSEECECECHSEPEKDKNKLPGFRFETKDSGKREEYDSGMVRDTQDGKPRFDLLIPLDVPYRHQFLTRVAELLGRGAEKYSDRNWEKASGSAELDRFKSSAHRHLMQWVAGESDEDHAAAVVFNLLAYETIKWKMDNGS
jgi:hypothetical protein